jgi:hypothetical protein
MFGCAPGGADLSMFGERVHNLLINKEDEG